MDDSLASIFVLHCKLSQAFHDGRDVDTFVLQGDAQKSWVFSTSAHKLFKCPPHFQSFPSPGFIRFDEPGTASEME